MARHTHNRRALRPMAVHAKLHINGRGGLQNIGRPNIAMASPALHILRPVPGMTEENEIGNLEDAHRRNLRLARRMTRAALLNRRKARPLRLHRGLVAHGASELQRRMFLVAEIGPGRAG